LIFKLFLHKFVLAHIFRTDPFQETGAEVAWLPQRKTVQSDRISSRTEISDYPYPEQLKA
jgi:hypothetical protein